MQDELKTSEASEFNDKRILVTGGSRGIGEAIVQRLSRGGGKVIATARSLPSGKKDRLHDKPRFYSRIRTSPDS